MPWGAAASVAGSVISGALGSDSADDAAKASAKATAASNAMLQKQQNENTAAFAPYVNTGNLANSRLSYLLGYGPDGSEGTGGDKYNMQDFVDYNTRILQAAGWKPSKIAKQAQSDAAIQYADYQGGDKNGWGLNDPAHMKAAGFRDLAPGTPGVANADGQYGSLLKNFSQNDLNNDVVYNNGLQFGLDQGTSALNRLASANGGIDSGATLKALTRYANDYGTTKASGAYDRFTGNKLNTYNMLSGQQGVGLNATNSNQSLNSNLLTAQSANTMNNGQAQGQYGIQGAGAINNAVQGGIGNLLYNNRTSTPSNSSIVGASQLGGGPGINLSGYTSSIPWYA